MKFKTLLFMLALTVWAARLRADDPKKLECPADLSEDALEDFRDDAIANLVAGNYGATKDKLGSCFPDGIPRCYADLAYYARLKTEGTPAQWADDYSDASDINLTMKSEKELPAEFIPPGSQGIIKIPENIEELAAKKGWKVLSYKTRSTGGFDRPPNLTLIAIPGKDKDIFIQISPQPKADAIKYTNEPKPRLSHAEIATGQNTATIITTDKTVNPPLGQLRRLTLSSDDSDHKAYRWSNHLLSQECMQCHSMPLRSISPRGYRVTNGSEKRMSASDEKKTEEINQMMMVDQLTWGDMKDRGTGHLVHRGPAIDSQPLGWAPENSRTRRPEYIKECAKQGTEVKFASLSTFNHKDDIYRYTQQVHDMDKIDAQKVSTNMSCMQCHNGSIRGPLHEGFGVGEIYFKVLVDKSMPPGANLTADERLALVTCLLAERGEVREDWLRRGDWMRKMACHTMQKPASAAKADVKSTEPATQKDSNAVH